MRRRDAFTLVELLVVILVIALVSAATLPTVLPALNHRQISESARLVQAAIEGCRDAAIRSNTPCGLRLIADPMFPGSTTTAGVPLAVNRLMPIEPAPDYSEGLVSIWADGHPASVPYPGGGGIPYPAGALRLEAAPYDANGLPVAAASWFWNVRVGDRVRIGQSGHLYTVVGPLAVGATGNPELFANIGEPGTQSPIIRTFATAAGPRDERVEFLYLVNGMDDDGDGYVDEGSDGLGNDTDSPVNLVDEIDEWEPETWRGPELTAGTVARPYTIKRRPVPTQGARTIELPSGIVIDLTTWDSTRERSRLTVDPETLTVEIMVSPDGQVRSTTRYSTPAASGASPWLHLVLAERGDVFPPEGTTAPLLPMPQGTPGYAGTRFLKGERRIVSVNARSGLVTTTEGAEFDGTDINRPFYAAQSGGRGER